MRKAVRILVTSRNLSRIIRIIAQHDGVSAVFYISTLRFDSAVKEVRAIIITVTVVARSNMLAWEFFTGND